MATTHSFTTSSYDGRYLKVDLTQTYNGNRTSTITGTLSVLGGSVLYYATGPTTVTVGGKQMYYSARRAWDSGYDIVTKNKVINLTSFTVSHDDDGNATLATSIATAIYTSTVSSKNGGNWVLDSCGAKVVAPTISAPSISSLVETSASASFSVTSNGGATVSSQSLKLYSSATSSTVLQTITSTGGSFTGLTPGTTYYVGAEATNSAGTTTSNRSAFTTVLYPYLTKVSESFLTADYTQTLTLYNPLGRTVTLSMVDKETNETVKTTNSTSTSWSYTLTSSNMATYLGTTKTQSTVKYVLTYGSITSTLDSSYKYGLNTSIITPTWSSSAASAITYEDTNTTITAITGNNQTIVQGLSSLKIGLNQTFLASNPASGLYGATIASYNVAVNSTTSYNSLGANGANTYSCTAPSGDILYLYTKVIDSRGVSSTVYLKQVAMTKYYIPRCSLEAKREGGYSENLIINMQVDWAIGTGNIGNIYYRYKKTTTSTWSSWSSDISGVSYDVNYAYDIQAYAVDKVGKQSDTVSVTVPIGQFPFFIDVEQEAIGVNCFPGGRGIWNDGYKQPVFRSGTSKISNDIGEDGDIFFWIQD